MQCLFALIVLFVFVVAALVGTSAIKMPQWARSLDQYSDEERAVYAGALLGPTCFFFFLLLIAGVLQMRREATVGVARGAV